MTFSKELLKGSTQQLILSVLKDNELYGYQIIKVIRTKSDEALQLGEGTIYPILHSLEKKGFLKSRWVTQKGIPDRKYYRITRKGQTKLKEDQKNWENFKLAVDHVATSSL